MEVQTLKDKTAFDIFLTKPGLVVVNFGTSWNPSSKELNKILTDLKNEFKDEFDFAYIDAEEVTEVSAELNIGTVPIITFHRNGREIHRLLGLNADELRDVIMTETFNKGVQSLKVSKTLPSRKDFNAYLLALIKMDRVTLFMKGTPEMPQCGFSRQMVNLLNELNVKFWSFDILSDEDVRQGLKRLSDWPTYPQVYLDGELLGGLDVIREEIKDPEFVNKLPKVKD